MDLCCIRRGRPASVRCPDAESQNEKRAQKGDCNDDMEFLHVLLLLSYLRTSVAANALNAHARRNGRWPAAASLFLLTGPGNDFVKPTLKSPEQQTPVARDSSAVRPEHPSQSYSKPPSNRRARESSVARGRKTTGPTTTTA